MLLITGATGNSGSHLMRELEASGHADSLRCLVREGTDVSNLRASVLRPEIRVGDLRDSHFLDTACRSVDTVMHIASIKFSLDIVRAAIRSGVRRVILVHTTGVYSRYKSAAQEYLEIENELQSVLATATHQMQVVILRPTMIFGQPRDRNISVFIRLVDKYRLIPLVDGGKSMLQPVHGRDLGKAFYQVLTAERLPESDYILSGERPVTMSEMLECIAESLEKRVHFVDVPLPLSVSAAMAIKWGTFGKINVVERVQRMGENRNFDHSAARRDFNYRPSSFLDNIRDEVELYRTNRGVA